MPMDRLLFGCVCIDIEDFGQREPIKSVVELDRLPGEWITQLHNGCFVALVQRCPARVSGA